MHTNRALSLTFLISFVLLVSSGSAVPESLKNDWKPIVSENPRTNSRRSYYVQENRGITASPKDQPSGISSSDFGYKNSEVIGATLPPPSWIQSFGTKYRSGYSQNTGRSLTTQPTGVSVKPTARSSYRRSLDIRVTDKSDDNSASSLKRSFDTQSVNGRAFSSNWFQNSLNILKSISQKSSKIQAAKKSSRPSKLYPSSRSDTVETPAITSQPDTQSEKSEITSSWFPSSESAEYRVLKRVFDDCLKSGESVNCLKDKTVTFLDRVSRVKSIPLFDGISLARVQNANLEPRILNEPEIEENNGRDLNGKSDRLDQMIYDKLINFWNTHTIDVDFSAQSAGEGRGRGKKLAGIILTALASSAATVGPLAFKGLAAFAFKALVAAKMALVLASLLALKSFSHHGGGEGHRSITEEREDSAYLKPQGRSFQVLTEDTHKMAYSAQLQKPIMVL